MSTPDWPGTALWDFSLRAYSQPEVEAICLSLQDNQGFDVNLVLLATWAAATGRRLDGVRAAELRRFGDGYQACVMQPVRQARRSLKSLGVKPALAPLLAERRRALLALELDLERLEQLQLAALIDPPAGDIEPRDGALLAANLRFLYPDRPVSETALAVLSAILSIADMPAGSDCDEKTNG